MCCFIVARHHRHTFRRIHLHYSDTIRFARFLTLSLAFKTVLAAQEHVPLVGDFALADWLLNPACLIRLISWY